MQEQYPLQQYLSDYPNILKGLKKLSITTLTDFQQQLLSIDPSALNNVIISAPQSSGKLLGIIFLMLKKFYSEQQATIMFVVHSKDLSQKVTYLLAALVKTNLINMFMQNVSENNSISAPKNILVGSPLQFEKLSKQNKQKIHEVAVVQTQLLLSFGFKQSLFRMIETLKNIPFKFICVKRSSDIQEMKQKYFNKITKIDYQSPETTKQQNIEKKGQNKKDAQCTHFYEVGDKINIAISLYVTLKFNLVNPKILVLCQNLKEVYRFYMLCDRCKLKGLGIYNHENPVSLKFYVLSNWMTDNTNILFTTKQLFKELDQNLFKDQVKKAYKRKQFQLVNLSTIITLGLSYIQKEDYQMIYDVFVHKPFIMNFIQNTQTQIQNLHELIKYQQQTYNSVKSKEIPITKKQLQGFRYRINDVYNSLSKQRINQFMELDLKRKIMKSPDLKQYFIQNPKEKEILVKAINNLNKRLENTKVTISEYVPEYLVPERLKAAYQQKMKNMPQQEVPAYHEKVTKVLRHINIQDQNPQTTDVSRLKLLSAGKRWKLQHGFKLKKRNLKNQKKGIFQNS